MRSFRRSLAFSVCLISATLGCQTLCGPSAAPATNVKLPALFSDNMVLQRDMPVRVWGWADPGGTVSVSVAKKKARTTVGPDGRWSLMLKRQPAGGPHELTITGATTTTFKNVMFGDVWIGSGQSNMQWPVKQGDWGVLNRDQEVAAANCPNIRLFSVPMKPSLTPKDDVESKGWRVCSPESLPTFSAVAYFFGRELHQHLNVPIGMIQSAYGGTVAEAWTSAETLSTLPEFAPAVAQLQKDIPNASAIRKEFETKLGEWEQSIEEFDGGYQEGRPAWAAGPLDTKQWPVMELPQMWETAGLPELDGVVWFRKEVTLPAAWAAKELTLSLGAINDFDRTFFNGEEVGRFEIPDKWETPRLYTIPARLAKDGKNVITVRVRDIGYRGGFGGKPEDLRLYLSQAPGTETMPLAGAWRYKVGVDMRNVPPRPQPPAIIEGNPNVPTVLYNAMIKPLVPYTIRGAIWYQGESNAGRAYQYRTLFPAMIQDWRKKWGQGDFPFLFVQLANFLEVKAEPEEDAWAELREAQLMTLAQPKTGMAVILDIGEAKDIHPKNKQDVGRRLALAARHVAYGEKLVYSGPIYRKMAIENGKIRLWFDHVGGGLVAKGGELRGFAVASEDHKFVWGKAGIEGDTVVVYSPEAKFPVAVRYAWAANPVCNLYNQEGLPASPFRTDDWPGITMMNK
ncbi:MAG: 9-O-acetylesterase [Candidatus Hydrogenedentes bacterium]|nr:9-O-acetylesterase [Candidatus Hydrogenedentota bacterium]